MAMKLEPLSLDDFSCAEVTAQLFARSSSASARHLRESIALAEGSGCEWLTDALPLAALQPPPLPTPATSQEELSADEPGMIKTEQHRRSHETSDSRSDSMMDHAPSDPAASCPPLDHQHQQPAFAAPPGTSGRGPSSSASLPVANGEIVIGMPLADFAQVRDSRPGRVT